MELRGTSRNTSPSGGHFGPDVYRSPPGRRLLPLPEEEEEAQPVPALPGPSHHCAQNIQTHGPHRLQLRVDPMTIRKYYGKEANLNRCVPIKCVPISPLAVARTSHIILLRAQIATNTHAHGESDEKKRQAGVNKYRAQKIASSTHARGDSLEMRLYRPTDSQPVDGFGPKFYTDLHS
ncbi:hypothetical protein AVEN_103398-1 [Araneus ventricosus]|uniref:Uncharacterized protein n=1 Tax=Araneus ventricosus TaxID=182803 RepID=A0A4Y2K5G4_ARAVE|nr:hypothetical protein AVEN_103398-1 [Araneus ventricosus]